jgi:hypothetical protein
VHRDETAALRMQQHQQQERPGQPVVVDCSQDSHVIVDESMNRSQVGVKKIQATCVYVARRGPDQLQGASSRRKTAKRCMDDLSVLMARRTQQSEGIGEAMVWSMRSSP